MMKGDAARGGMVAAPTFILSIAIALLAASAAAGLIGPTSTLFQFIPLDYNEGWNAFWSDIALAGGQLYPPLDSTIANNYPPLSFYLVGALGHLIGDNIFAGRLVAMLSLAAVAANVFFWTRLAGAARSCAAFGAALFLASFVRYAPSYLGVDDPQLLAHAIMLSGATLLWRYGWGTRALAGGSLLMILGGLTKHLLLPLPLAATAWIALYRRDRLLPWIGCSAAWLGMAIALIAGCYGAAFFHSLSAGRDYSAHLASNAAHRVLHDIGWVSLASTTVFAAFIGRHTSKRLEEGAAFGSLYLLLSVAVGVFASGGAGVDRNAYFDFVIAVCLCVALGLESIRARERLLGTGMRGASCAALAGLAMGTLLVVQAAARVPAHWREWQTTSLRAAAAAADIQAISSAGRGHAACEMPALCYWAHADFAVDFYNFGQKLALGSLPPAACERVFVNGRVDLVQIDPRRVGAPLTRRLPAACNELIADHYTVFRQSPFGSLMRRPPTRY